MEGIKRCWVILFASIAAVYLLLDIAVLVSTLTASDSCNEGDVLKIVQGMNIAYGIANLVSSLTILPIQEVIIKDKNAKYIDSYEE
eukprot:855714_1